MRCTRGEVVLLCWSICRSSCVWPCSRSCKFCWQAGASVLEHSPLILCLAVQLQLGMLVLRLTATWLRLACACFQGRKYHGLTGCAPHPSTLHSIARVPALPVLTMRALRTKAACAGPQRTAAVMLQR